MAKTEEIDYTVYLNKKATSLQSRFAEWLMGDRVGYDPNSAKNKAAAFAEGVRLGVALRIPFQASEENRAATEEEREARLAEKEEAKAERKSARKAAPAAADTDDDEDEAPKARGAKAAKAVKSAPVKAGARGRRATASSDSDAPF